MTLNKHAFDPRNWYKSFRKKSKEIRLMLIAALLILVGVIGSTLVLHDFGNIRVMKIVIPTENGQWVAADLYRPVTATRHNKAPLVVVVPGFQRTRETQTNMALELARRGIVTICIDPYAQGGSSASFSSQSATTEGYGAMAVVEYVYNTPNLNYVDKTKIGMTGHSAGGNAALRSAQHFGVEVIDGERDQSKLKAIFVSGYVLTFTESALTSVRSNVGMDYPYFDEGAFRNARADEPGIHDGDMRTALESITLVNSGLHQNGQDLIDEVEIGRIYGSPHNQTMRMVYNVRDLHALQIYNRESTANMLEYFEIALDYDMDLSHYNQTYMVKEWFTGLSLLGAMLFLFGFGAALLKTSFFAPLVHPLPNKARVQTRSDKLLFWGLFVFSALVACFIFIPMAQAAQIWFPDAQNAVMTSFFPYRMLNSVLLWAVFNGTLGLILFFLVYALRSRHHGATLEAFKISPKELLKTLLYAITVVGTVYLILHLVYKFFHVDFRFLFLAIRVLENNGMLLYSLMYIPLFYIFYLSNSVRVNLTMRVEGWSEFKSTLIGCLGNSVGLLLILVIQYSAYVATGRVFWTTEWLYVNILFGVIPLMFILPIYNRYWFNRTGRVYGGALIACILFILMALMGSVAYIPL